MWKTGEHLLHGRDVAGMQNCFLVMRLFKIATDHSQKQPNKQTNKLANYQEQIRLLKSRH